MLEFNEGPRAMSYVLGLKEAFPFIRSFLDDSDDAIVSYFLGTQKITLKDLKRLNGALKGVVYKLAQRYPSMMPENATSNTSVLAPKKIRYRGEDYITSAVFKLTQMVIHLQASTAAFIALVEQGSDINQA